VMFLYQNVKEDFSIFIFLYLDMLIILLETITKSVGEWVFQQANGMPTLEHHLIY
jgi:hypothetical protein